MNDQTEVHIGSKDRGFNVTIGNLIQIVVLLVTAVAAYVTLSANFGHVTDNQETIRETQKSIRSDLAKVREDVSEIREGRAGSVQRLNDHERRIQMLEQSRSPREARP